MIADTKDDDDGKLDVWEHANTRAVVGIKVTENPRHDGERKEECLIHPAHDPNIFGHFIFNPSNHLIYKSSAIGDFRAGDDGSGVVGFRPCPTPCPCPDDEDEEASSSCSTTTSPLDVISLRRVTRLWGKRPRVVLMCCLTDWFLHTCHPISHPHNTNTMKKKIPTHSLIPAKISKITLYANSGFASFKSANPLASILSASISFASISSRVAFCNCGMIISSTIERAARDCSDAMREWDFSFEGDFEGEVRGGVVSALVTTGNSGFPSFERRLPTNWFDIRSEPAASTRLTGRTVSIPLPISAGRRAVPCCKSCRAA